MENQDKNKINDPEEHTLDVAIGILRKLNAEKKNETNDPDEHTLDVTIETLKAYNNRKKERQPEQDLAENTYIDATLAGLKRATEDDFKEGKISKVEYEKWMERFKEVGI